MKVRPHIVICCMTCLLAGAALAQDNPPVIPLWENGAPGFENRKNEPEQAESYWVKNVHNPSLTVFLPPRDKATGAAVVVCPGGGHRLLVFNGEGRDPARYLASIGVAAFALKYRLGREEGTPYSVAKHALDDGQRAMRLVRSRAKEWGIDPTRVGILGFSAGGEVVSMVAYAPGDGDPNAKDPVERESSRPDFQMLVYPGPLGIPQTIPDNAPPAFLLVADDDLGAARSVMNLLNKFREVAVPVEAHILARGGHAFNMGNRSQLKSIKGWPELMVDWMADNFILDPTGREAEAKRREELKQQVRRFRERQRPLGQQQQPAQ